MPAQQYTQEFITSVVVGKDVVPRIGLRQMESLRADLINAIKRSVDPKVIFQLLRACKKIHNQRRILCISISFENLFSSEDTFIYLHDAIDFTNIEITYEKNFFSGKLSLARSCVVVAVRCQRQR